MIQVLKNLAREVSYRSLVALGIASVQGIPVASFEKEDAERLLFFCNGQDSGFHIQAGLLSRMPTWSSSFTRKRSAPNPETKPIITNNTMSKKRLRFGKDYQSLKREGELVTCRLKIDAIRPIPHSRQKMLPFLAFHETDSRDEIKAKPSHMIVQSSKTASATHRKSMSSSAHPQPVISLNPLPLKKHECNRAPIQICSEVSLFSPVTV